MPDIWTTRRDHMKGFLQQLGAECGVEPRIIRPRDKEWTCHVDGPGWIGDIYLHDVRAIWTIPLINEVMLGCLIAGALLGIKLNRFTIRK
ncbi:MAG: hypothetical protein J5J00_05425 [Deltaproteobacteria bacterium]|nr:hypothetical protein [Deltaproteobacteria bacterium]